MLYPEVLCCGLGLRRQTEQHARFIFYDGGVEKLYTYVGPRDLLTLSPPEDLVQVVSAESFYRWAQNKKVRSEGYTVTYVVLASGELRMAERQTEHVACAEGGPVRAAGEMSFEIHKREVHITSLSNLSTGFCPEPEYLEQVLALVASLQVDLSTCDVHFFEFRRCQECQSTNVIKVGDPFCVVCDAPLPEEWNF